MRLHWLRSLHEHIKGTERRLTGKIDNLDHKLDSQAHANAQRAKALPKPSHHETNPH